MGLGPLIEKGWRMLVSSSLLPTRFTASSLSRAVSVSLTCLPPSRSMNLPPPAAAVTGGENNGGGDVIVQYVVLRRDLIDTWPVGSVVAQGCHASVAAVWAHRDHPDTTSYLSPSAVDSMHKVALEVKGETQMRNLSEKLTAGGIDHKLWIEQPENIPTCLATRPYPKSQLASYFKKLKLCK